MFVGAGDRLGELGLESVAGQDFSDLEGIEAPGQRIALKNMLACQG